MNDGPMGSGVERIFFVSTFPCRRALLAVVHLPDVLCLETAMRDGRPRQKPPATPRRLVVQQVALFFFLRARIQPNSRT